MRDATDALVLDLVEWIAREPRPYSEVIDTWRTSCPRLTIWEDAVDRGYVARRPTADGLRLARMQLFRQRNSWPWQRSRLLVDL